MDQVLRQVPDLNTAVPFATGDQINELAIEGGCLPVTIPADIGGCGGAIPVDTGAYNNDYSNDYN